MEYVPEQAVTQLPQYGLIKKRPPKHEVQFVLAIEQVAQKDGVSQSRQ